MRVEAYLDKTAHLVAGRGISMRWNSSRCDE
jgi:hypothetical protein